MHVKQINLNHCEARADIALVCKQYRECNKWLADTSGKAGIWLVNDRFQQTV